MKRLLISLIIFSSLQLLTTLPAAATTLTAGPYLQRVSDDAVTILLRSEAETSVQVRYRPVGAEKWKTTDNSAVNTRHRFRLTGLRAATTYEYLVRTSGKTRLTPTSSFTTQATITKTTPLTVAAIGDSGTNTVPQYQIALQMQRFSPDLIVHTGDIAYDSGSTEEYLNSVFLPYQSLLNHIPFYGSIGNHDFTTEEASPYKDFFEIPRGYDSTEDYYAFDYSGVHFISLNTNLAYTEDSDQYNWLEADLKKSKKNKSLWTIVFFHHPVYSSGMHGTTAGMADALSPLFEDYGVDLVLNGHDHAYERNDSVNGVDYLVTGGGGAVNLYNQDNLDLNPYSETFISSYHFVGLTLRKKNITLQAIDNTGEIIDSFKIKQDHAL